MTRILRGLNSRRLPCGCLLGIYETYDGRVVSIVDARGEACRDGEHAEGRQTVLQDTASAPASS
ncbi:MAG: hypothetical protein NTV05_06540 [Acidobacteria bacterium]|nr:hypothetical protein [Acidobacteriota bacterium]